MSGAKLFFMLGDNVVGADDVILIFSILYRLCVIVEIFFGHKIDPVTIIEDAIDPISNDHVFLR